MGPPTTPVDAKDLAVPITCPILSLLVISVIVARPITHVADPAAPWMIRPKKSAHTELGPEARMVSLNSHNHGHSDEANLREGVHATRIVPIRHPVRAKSSGIFLLGVLSAKWAIMGPEIRETKPWIVSSAVVRLWV